MKISLHLQEKPFHMVSKNPEGNSISIDASPEIGGLGKGVRPTELLLMGVAGCSGIDILSILEKQKQNVTGFDVNVDGEKERVDSYTIFKHIQVEYIFQGEIDPFKAKKAIELSLGKYCSVSKMMEKSAKIDFSFSINGIRY